MLVFFIQMVKEFLPCPFFFFNLFDPELTLFFPDQFLLSILVGLRCPLSFWQLVIDKTLDLEFSLNFFSL